MAVSRRITPSQQVNKLKMPQNQWDLAAKGSPKGPMFFDPEPKSNRLPTRNPAGPPENAIARHNYVEKNKEYYGTGTTSKSLASHPDEGTRGPSKRQTALRPGRYRSQRRGRVIGTNRDPRRD